MSIDSPGVRSSQPEVAGWLADPTGRHEYRYFDGVAWSEHVADAGIQSEDPIYLTPPTGDQRSEPTTTADEPIVVPTSGYHSWPAPEPALAVQSPELQVEPEFRAPQPAGPQVEPEFRPPPWWYEPTPAGLSMTEAVTRVLSNYAKFSGRASRSEFWYWFLAMNLALLAVAVVVGGVGGLIAETPEGASFAVLGVVGLLALGVLLPNLAVGVRRLHDTGKPGGFWFLSLIPYVGGIILLVLLAQRGTEGPNMYGQPPR